ncbi:hypothetical protein ASNO1_42480 [Corallococcus caeni]|uniref:Uncharacterized protein n=1 Tax=Corallococcus caeni TaxID=3082388 RepID=A0ABQ6QVD5_9BACT|nr:hypothetical protein ASNO1_42480 [Corallococcus sp. NO1]
MHEAPVEDGRGRQQRQLVDVQRHTAATQSEVAGCVQQDPGGQTVPGDTRDVADLLERYVATVKAQHHGKAGGATIDIGGLADFRNALGPRSSGQAAQRGKTVHHGGRGIRG